MCVFLADRQTLHYLNVLFNPTNSVFIYTFQLVLKVVALVSQVVVSLPCVWNCHM